MPSRNGNIDKMPAKRHLLFILSYALFLHPQATCSLPVTDFSQGSNLSSTANRPKKPKQKHPHDHHKSTSVQVWTQTESNFSLNSHFLSASPHPFIQLPGYLLQAADAVCSTPDPSNNSETLLRRSVRTPKKPKKPIHPHGTTTGNDANCTSQTATSSCCNMWYIPQTAQRGQCDLSSRHKTFIDEFNPASESLVRTCLYSSLTTLEKCCKALSMRTKKFDKKRCVQTRQAILHSGIRVCIIQEMAMRISCCKNVLKGRTELYDRCAKGVPTFVNRRAPCVFKDKSSQEACCAEFFPRTASGDAIRPYQICVSAVSQHEGNPRICYETDRTEKKKCCRTDQLFGVTNTKLCMAHFVPPCRTPKFEQRAMCCYAHFPGDKKDSVEKRLECQKLVFRSCQIPSWKDRLACCASSFRVGSTDMRDCLYQFVNPLPDENDEKTRFYMCSEILPRGSISFWDCLRYPILMCRLSSKDAAKLRLCCLKKFEANSVGYNVCIQTKPMEEYRTNLEDSFQFTSLSNPVHKPADRVVLCQKQYAKGSWYFFACLSEMTFADDEMHLYHFTLFVDTAVEGYVQFTCAIYSEREREGCCEMNYPGTGTSFHICMSWRPTLGRDYSIQLDDAAEKRLAEELKKSVAVNGRKKIEKLEAMKADEGFQVQKFLGCMKKTERALKNRNEDFRDDKLNVIFREFKRLLHDAIRQNRAATFFHVASKAWTVCAMVNGESFGDRDGMVYCSRLTDINGNDFVPRRKPVFWWDGGAIEKIVSEGGEISRAADRWGDVRDNDDDDNHGDDWYLEMDGIGDEMIEISESSSDYTRVNLFGDSLACALSNLRYSCSAFCCDTYFAYSWLCEVPDLECFE